MSCWGNNSLNTRCIFSKTTKPFSSSPADEGESSWRRNPEDGKEDRWCKDAQGRDRQLCSRGGGRSGKADAHQWDPLDPPRKTGGGGGGQHSTAQSSVYLPVWFHRLPALGLQQVTSSAALCEVFSGIIYAKCLAEQSTFSIIVPSYWFLAQNRHFIDVNVLPNLLRGSFLITT